MGIEVRTDTKVKNENERNAIEKIKHIFHTRYDIYDILSMMDIEFNYQFKYTTI